MNYIQKIINKLLVKKIGNSSRIRLYGAVLLRSKSYCLNIEQNSSHCKHKGVQDHNKYNLEGYRFCLENKEIKYGVNCSFRSNKHEIIMVNKKKIDLNTFNDKRWYIDIYNSVPWGYYPSP